MRWIFIVAIVAAVLVMGGAEMNDESITWQKMLAVASFLAVAAIIANWPKRSKKFVSNARRVRPRA